MPLKVEGGGWRQAYQLDTSQCGLYSAPCSLSGHRGRHGGDLWLDSHPTDAVTIEVEDPSILALDKGPSSEGLGLMQGAGPGETRFGGHERRRARGLTEVRVVTGGR